MMAKVRARFSAWFFRHFFHLLLITSSLAMWLVPQWLLVSLGGPSFPWWMHAIGCAAIYSFHRRVVRRRRVPNAWLRRYSAVAFVSLLCAGFLIASAAIFGLATAATALATADGAALVASAARLWGVGGVAVLASAMLFGYTFGQRQLEVSRHEIGIDGWSGRLRLLQLSDIHIGQNLEIDELSAFVERANRENPDLICLTGDIVDGPHADVDRFFPHLARLRARFGVIAVLGNHDFYAGADRVADALQRHGMTVLRDRALTLDADGRSLHVIGLDDRGVDWARGKQRDAVLTSLLDEAPRDLPTLLLVHRPDVFRQAAEWGVDLTLSGHTHGGQLAVPWFGGRRRNFAEIVTVFDRGHFCIGDAQLYVNCGLGVTGQRIRLFTPREISVFDLRPRGALEPAAETAVPLRARPETA